jgi:hypothetical protein
MMRWPLGAVCAEAHEAEQLMGRDESATLAGLKAADGATGRAARGAPLCISFL